MTKDEFKKFCKEQFYNKGFVVMSKKRTYQGNVFMSPQIEYEEYENEELGMYFQQNFDEWIIPAIEEGLDYIEKRISDNFFAPNYMKRDMKNNMN